MRTPAAAIAWELRQRHRWGLRALLAYFAALAILRLFVLRAERMSFDNEMTFAFAVIVPITAMFFYCLALFTYGLSGDLAARQSMYPARMFTLPVTTNALAGWPMLYGSVAMAVLWLAVRFLALWPSGVHVPVFWPMLLGPSLLAWTQALTWMPYPLRGMRVLATVFWLMIIDAIVMTALELRASEAVMVALLVPHVPLAYVVARIAVARARSHVIPSAARDLGGRAARKHYRSKAHAQMSFEWHQHGRALPAMVAIVLPVAFALFFVFHETPVIIYELLILVLLTPPLMSAFVAATVSKPLTPFLATKPLSDASLVGAKLNVTVRSTLTAWLIVLATTPLVMRLSGTWPLLVDFAEEIVKYLGTPRAIVLALLVLLFLIATTWKQLVQSLYIGLTGREWAIKGSLFATLALLTILFPLGHWAFHRRITMAWLWKALPWILAALALLKFISAAWIAMRLYDRRLLTDRTLVLGAACWSTAVLALYGLLVWTLPTLIFREYFLALVAILSIPLARVSAAPLALAWSRHQP